MRGIGHEWENLWVGGWVGLISLMRANPCISISGTLILWCSMSFRRGKLIGWGMVWERGRWRDGVSGLGWYRSWWQIPAYRFWGHWYCDVRGVSGGLNWWVGNEWGSYLQIVLGDNLTSTRLWQCLDFFLGKQKKIAKKMLGKNFEEKKLGKSFVKKKN